MDELDIKVRHAPERGFPEKGDTTFNSFFKPDRDRHRQTRSSVVLRDFTRR